MRRAIIRFYPAATKFHRLTLLDLVGVKDRRRIAKVRCECGRVLRVRFNFVRSGHCKSCGCLRRDRARAQISLNRPKVSPTLTHGGTTNPKLIPLYRVYRRMLARCYNPNASGYKNWGGRGIYVCRRWRGEHGFQRWLEDMGPRIPGFWIDRKDTNKNYSPANTRWVHPKVQRNNQRRMKRAA
jgi:hypothetical protein